MKELISKILLLFFSLFFLCFNLNKEKIFYNPTDIIVEVKGHLKNEERILLKKGDKYQDLLLKVSYFEDTDLRVLDFNYPLFNNQEIIFEKINPNKVNINEADFKELCSLPGIGEKTANKIIQYRQTTSFKRIQDITKISGIGEKKYEVLKEYITI